ncbi:MAG: DUF1249 domain-containing protein [Stenotrophobium sp.]
MQITNSEYLCPCCGKPRRISHLMEIYERNFRLLQRLLPELDLPFDRAVSPSETDPPLHLQVLARDRYTLTIKLTYQFTGDNGTHHRPDLWIRVYRDAAVAEALECSHRPPWLAEDDADPQAGVFFSDQWRRNVLLGKWLDYLLERGHGFGMAERPRLALAV